MKLYHSFFSVILLAVLISACSTPRMATETEDLDVASISTEELLDLIPDYSNDLKTISGVGRALISEPGNSDRVTLQFQSNRTSSLIDIRTSVGIQGGQILVDGDSLLIYNRVDQYAEKVSVAQSDLTSVGSIASLNMLDLFNFTLTQDDIETIFDGGNNYVVLLRNEATVTVSKADGLIMEVQQSKNSPAAPYRKIEYEGYGEIDNFQLPRKMTILSRDEKSRATLLVQQLEVNQSLPPLTIDLPDNISIYRQ
ncbi:MAG: DUF4292 domain-containing protein [Balneolaceae bacterium]